MSGGATMLLETPREAQEARSVGRPNGENLELRRCDVSNVRSYRARRKSDLPLHTYL